MLITPSVSSSDTNTNLNPNARNDILCADCGKLLVLTKGNYGLFYQCVGYPFCSGNHSAFPSGSPRGTPGNAETRRERRLLHQVIKKLESYGFSKKQAYQILCDVSGISGADCHVSKMTAKQCRSIILKLIFLKLI